MRIVQTLMAHTPAPVRKDTLEKESHAEVKLVRLWKKQNNCSSEIIALLSNKLNANCTNTNGSHNCICKKGYIINGQPCQRRLEKQYLMLSKAAFHNKYCLRNWGYDQEATKWFSRPDLVLLLSYGFHHMHTFTFFEGLKYNTRGYFTSCSVYFRARKERR